MKELEDIIQDYLQAKDTDYTLMINGDWGCGKTYYLNHEFKDFVEQLNCPFTSDVTAKASFFGKDRHNDTKSLVSHKN